MGIFRKMFPTVRQTEEQLMLAIESMHDVVLIFDKDSTILYANEAYTKVIGFPREKIIGLKLSDIEPGALGCEVIKTGKPLINVYSYIESAKRDMVGDVTPIFYEGELVGAVAVMRSIETVFHLNRQLQQMTEQWKRQTTDVEMDPVFHQVIGQDPHFQDAVRLASRVAKTDATVLLRGETGVGKDVFARCIHQASNRSDGPFVAINMAAIPESLAESELFGYEEGAFTGASKRGKKGKFEQADGGTLFLDEIGEMSLGTQAKLLRALQERQIERVGGTQSRTIDVRVIAATNRDLEQMVEQGQFRADLFYRLHVVPIEIPPLRNRIGDIPLLMEFFLEKCKEKYHKNTMFSSAVISVFQSYPWPGNIRELQNAVEQMVILSNAPVLTQEAIPPSIATWDKIRHQENVQAAETYTPIQTNLKFLIEKLERETIQNVLRTAKTKSEAIHMLGISRRAFYQKLKQYNLE